MTATLEPIGERLLVEIVPPEQVLASGIILPEQALEKPQRGLVTAVGDEVKRIAVGDEVLYSKFGGTELKVEGQELVLLRESDVFVRVHEDAAEK